MLKDAEKLLCIIWLDMKCRRWNCAIHFLVNLGFVYFHSRLLHKKETFLFLRLLVKRCRNIVVHYLIGHEMLLMTLSNTVSCKSRFCIFVIHIYDTKSKRLESLDSLLKDAERFFCIIWLDLKCCRWNCAIHFLVILGFVYLSITFTTEKANVFSH